jgi:hypothetical protein
MSGHKFPTTQATQEALSDNVKQIAAAKGCGLSYIYSVASGGDKDPYINFREFFCHVAEGYPQGARAYIRDMTEIVLKFDSHKTDEPLVDLVSESTRLFVLFMTSRDKKEPLENQRGLLVQWMEAAERVAAAMDGQRQKLSAVEPARQSR